MPRYDKTRLLTNSSKYYEVLRKKRKVRKITHYATPIINNPGVLERASLASNSYIWKYGDRFYQIAATYYADPRFWWVIAWYNGKPTEADIKPGDVITIPVNIEAVLKVLGV